MRLRVLDPGVRRLAAQMCRTRACPPPGTTCRAALPARAEQIGYDLTLVAELNLNDIKGTDQPALDAWSTAAALAAVTERLELMVAVRPNFHQPALFAKQAANIDNGSAHGRLALNVVSVLVGRRSDQSYGLQFDQHDDRYGPHRASGWDVVDCLWTQTPKFNFSRDQRYTAEGCDLRAQARETPKPGGLRRLASPRGGQDHDRQPVRRLCHAWRRARGDRGQDRRHARPARGAGPAAHDLRMAAYAIVRDSEAEAEAEVERITTLDPQAPGFANFHQWLSGTELERELKVKEYSVSNRGLRPGLVGTAAPVRARIAEFEAVGLDLLLLQMSPQLEEMERFAAEVMS